MQIDAPETQYSNTGHAGQVRVSYGEALRVWCRVAALSFGGPAGQIAVMHRILVDERRWISEERFLHALNYCMLLPGPEAQQLATYLGWLLHRTLGGLTAGVLFVLPGFFSILGLSIVYAYYQQTLLLQSIFFGLKCAVLAIVIEAVIRIGKRVLRNGAMLALATSAFVALFFFSVPFPLVIVAAGLLGFVGGRLRPERFMLTSHHGPAGQYAVTEPLPVALHSVQPTWRRAMLISATWLAIWWGPIALLAGTWGTSSIYVTQGVFFSKAAVVTFGGAYSVLAYIGQQAVETHGWLQPGEMLDGLGMAETTPGPLIQVVQFVGFLGAFRQPTPLGPLAGGIVASLVTTWVTFAPCFLWIFLGAPYIERLRGNVLLNAALTAITAAVVGVILNLALWFGLHTLFAVVETWQIGPLRLLAPQWNTLSLAACLVTLLALLLTFYWRRGMATTLTLCAAAGMVLGLIFN